MTGLDGLGAVTDEEIEGQRSAHRESPM